ncbi:MAG TPA: response regulator [Microvirga sp.]|jgi:CheY-like chemotaxis protein
MADNRIPAILVVEDEPLVRLLVSELLLDEGFRVIEAANAAEALAVLRADVPVDVLYADVDMPPGIDGYALAHEVRAGWPLIEILVTSGRRWPTDGDLPAGAAFLAKPCPNDVVVSHVTAAVERVRAARQSASDEPRVIPFPKTA